MTIVSDTTVGFDDLVLDMMDLQVADKLHTSSEIPDRLNLKGWNASQVSCVWTVGPVTDNGQTWNADLLKKLGGKNLFSSVWESLKTRKQVGYGKRPAMEDDMCPATKRIKSGTHCVSASSLALSSNSAVFSAIDTPAKNSNMQSTPNMSNVSFVEDFPANRRRKKAKRSSIVATPKITEWLLRCSQDPATPGGSKHPSQSTPNQASGSKNNKRRRNNANFLVPPGSQGSPIQPPGPSTL